MEFSGAGDPTRSMRLLWGTQDKPRRGPKPKLTIGQITRAAIDIADVDGLDMLSMRRVGDRLGVTAMSLYKHLPGKAELLDLMLDAVYGELPSLPNGTPGQWRARLEAIARNAWALYLRHPWLLRIAANRPVLGPNSLAAYDNELRAVDGLGLTDVEMDQLVRLVADYVHGAVRGAVEPAHAEHKTGITDQQWWAAHEPLLTEVFDPDRFPLVARVGTTISQDYQAITDPARSFEFGLRVLLDGVQAMLRRTPEHDG